MNRELKHASSHITHCLCTHASSDMRPLQPKLQKGKSTIQSRQLQSTCHGVCQYSHRNCKHCKCRCDTISMALRLTSARRHLQGHDSWLDRESRHIAATLGRAQWADPSHLPTCASPLSCQPPARRSACTTTGMHCLHLPGLGATQLFGLHSERMPLLRRKQILGRHWQLTQQQGRAR